MLKRRIGLCWVVASYTALISPGNAQTEEPALAKSVKAGLIFEKSPEDPLFVNVFLHLVNVTKGDINWTADPIMGIQADLFDPAGKPAALPRGMGTDIASGRNTFTLPPGSRLDLLISHNWGIAAGSSNGAYIVELGSHLWFVPVEAVGSYTLHVKLYGSLKAPRSGFPDEGRKLLLDLVPYNVVITPTSN
jgi:hypothetical protein